MKVFKASQYGGPEVLQLQDINDPEVNTGQLLIKLKSTAANSGDARLRSLNVPGPLKIIMRLSMGWKKLRQPILGVVYAGVVEKVADDVDGFQVGDRIFGHLGMKTGAYSEKIVVDADSILCHMPDEMTFTEAAALPFGGLTALYFINKLAIQPNHSVMVYGAAGAVGSMAVQILKNHGFQQITAVAKQTHHTFLKEIGATHTLDYRSDEFLNDTHSYDIIFDAVGKLPKNIKKARLAAGGHFLTVGGLNVVKESKADLEKLVAWYQTGNLQAVVDSTYPFEELVAAHRHLDTSTKRGNIVILFDSAEAK